MSDNGNDEISSLQANGAYVSSPGVQCGICQSFLNAFLLIDSSLERE